MTTPEAEPAVTPARRLTEAIEAARAELPLASEAVRGIDATLKEYAPFISDLGKTAGQAAELEGAAEDPGPALAVVPAYTRFIGGNLEAVEPGFLKATEHLNAGSEAVEEARQALAELRDRPEVQPRNWDLDKVGVRVEQLGAAFDGAREVLADARNRLTSSRGELMPEEAEKAELTAGEVRDLHTAVDNGVQVARAELGHTADEVTLARANAGSAVTESENIARWLQDAAPGSSASSGTAASSEQDLRHRNTTKGPQTRGPRE